MSGGWYQRVGEVRGRIAAITPNRLAPSAPCAIRARRCFDAKVSLWISFMMESMVEMASSANNSGTTPLCGTEARWAALLTR